MTTNDLKYARQCMQDLYVLSAIKSMLEGGSVSTEIGAATKNKVVKDIEKTIPILLREHDANWPKEAL